MNNLYEEHQYQRNLLPWILVIGIWFVSIWHIYNYGFSIERFIYDILILFLLPLSITVLLYFFKLSILVDNEFLYFKMFPFHLTYRKIKLSDVVDANIEEYNKGRTFHGWGIGFSMRKNYKSYTLKGYKKVKILIKDGTELIIGTQNPKSLVEKLRIN
jgi:hypothetical protein